VAAGEELLDDVERVVLPAFGAVQVPVTRQLDKSRAANLVGVAQFEAYVASLKGRADISINAANLEKK